MKKIFSILLVLCLLGTSCLAEEAELLPEGWAFLGYTYGGITFPVPMDVEFYELTPQEQAMGIILICYNDEFTLQLRGFSPKQMTWEEFKKKMLAEPTAEVSLLGEDQSIMYVRNTTSTADSELVSIALNGLDGNLYKISIFTGVDEDYSPDASVWEIAQTVAGYTSQMDFLQWPLQENPAS